MAGVAGCLKEEVGGSDPLLGDPAAYVKVSLSSTDSGDPVDPPIVHLAAGGTVEWVVDDGDHEVAAYHPETHGNQRRIPADVDPWTSDGLSPGDSFDRVFDTEGVFDYVSVPHEVDGAVGTVIVGWPDPDEAPGLESPSEVYSVAAVDTLERQNERVRDVLEEVHE